MTKTKDRGVYFEIATDVENDFSAWCEQRPWIKKGRFIEAILVWVMATQESVAIAEILESARQFTATRAANELEAAAQRTAGRTVKSRADKKQESA